MNHLPNDRIVALAEGDAPRWREGRHLAACPECAREVAETAVLMARIRSGSDPPLPEERLARNAMRIDERIGSTEPIVVPRRPWRWHILVPLAAAAVAVILPRARDSATGSGAVISVDVPADLSEAEFDFVVQYLAEGTEELAAIHDVIGRGTSPWEDIDGMSGDELERLLAAMGANGCG